MKASFRSVVVFLGVLLSLGAHGTPSAPLNLSDLADSYLSDAIDAFAEEQFDSAIVLMQDSLALRPNHPVVLFSLADCYARAGKSEETLKTLERLAGLGFYFDIRNSAVLRGLQGSVAFETIAETFESNLYLIQRSQQVRHVPMGRDRPSALAHDPASNLYFVGLRSRPVLISLPERGQPSLRPLEAGDGFGVTALTHDARNNALWAVLSPVDRSEARESAMPTARLLRFDLELDRVVSSLEIPAGEKPVRIVAETFHEPTSRVLLLDQPNRRILSFDPETERFEVSPLAVLGRPTDLVTWPKDGSLLIADHDFGLWRVDPQTMSAARIPLPEDACLFGLHSIAISNGQLVGLQTALAPLRHVHIEFDAEERRVTSINLLETAYPDLEARCCLIDGSTAASFIAYPPRARDPIAASPESVETIAVRTIKADTVASD